MTKPVDPPKPVLSDRAEAERRARQAREAAALRENLRRRKQQIRARERTEPSDPGLTVSPPETDPQV